MAGKEYNFQTIKFAEKKINDPNVKTYAMITKKFKTDDRDLLEKILLFDEETQNRIFVNVDNFRTNLIPKNLK